MLMVTEGSMCESGPSYEWNYFIIASLRTGRKGKTRKSQDHRIASVFDKKYNSKCIQSTTCLSRPNKTSRKWEVC